MHDHNHKDIHHHEAGDLLEHHHTMTEEILCHLPYAIFSVALSFLVLSFLSSGTTGLIPAKVAHRLFHNFHYLHILFSATGAVLTFRRYSRNVATAMVVGVLVPTVFCTLSDMIIPYVGGSAMKMSMHFHLCFVNHLDAVLPFLIAGVINGFVMSSHAKSLQLFYSIGFHFFHIFISSMASVLYMVSFGLDNWSKYMGSLFVFMIFAVLLPCTLSDIVVPMFFALFKRKKP